jgi:hypothetical protein
MNSKYIFNVTTSIIYKFIILFITFLIRRLIYLEIGDSSIGFESLVNSIIAFISLSQLGMESTILFKFYKPIVNNNYHFINKLYSIYTSFTNKVAIIYLILGLLMFPVLNIFIVNPEELPFNYFISYIFTLFASIISLLSLPKLTYLIAIKKVFGLNSIQFFINLLQFLLQFLSVIYFRSFNLYIFSKFVVSLLFFLVFNYFFSKSCPNIKFIKKPKVDNPLIKSISDKSNSMFIHRIGAFLVNYSNSFIISFFLGLSILGKFSNYLLFVAAINTILAIIFNNSAAYFGQFYINAKKRMISKSVTILFYLNFFIGVFSFLFYFIFIDDFIYLLFGNSSLLDLPVKTIITISSFIVFIRSSNLMIRDSTGLYNYDKFKPIFEGIINVFLSIFLFSYFGFISVLLSNIITNLFINLVVENHIIFKYLLNKSYFVYIFKVFFLIGLFSLTIVIIPYIFNNIFDYHLILRVFLYISFSSALSFMGYIIFKEEIHSFRFKLFK